MKRVNLSDKVITALKSDIASGKLKKGTKIPSEPELMERYEVGRSTIREAIKTLAISGVLKVQQGSGTFVASKIKDEPLSQRLRRADFEEINTVRSLLEKEIVKLACQNRTDEDISSIQNYLMQRKKAIDSDQTQKCTDADIAFHVSIAKASKNKVLIDLYQNFTAVIRDFFTKRKETNMAYFSRSHHWHEELALAIVNRDQQAADQLIQTLLNNNY
ncbi:DNA-binding FadR family transcriptional regulator [Pedobacter cryoconitis]|uniref:DNA-binding FadR family transcriptional regulator n=1 Tax=Pedobacter cryoconitis TaxID=188932 RepID=A0A7W8ZHI0_9SPHI|nr:FadR/GntR family transcriptional regulator [Pedobacter cryoconitis]MBB5634139.1 DNA-binding FadR family transcriptional regulator [Pedobacter cryoconitis]